MSSQQCVVYEGVTLGFVGPRIGGVREMPYYDETGQFIAWAADKDSAHARLMERFALARTGEGRRMTTEQFADFTALWDTLQTQFNALVQCAMFPPPDGHALALVALIERYRDTEQAIDDLLFGIEYPDVDEP